MNIAHYFLLSWISTKCSSDQMFVNFPWRNHFLQLQGKSWFAYPLEILGHLVGNVALDLRKELKYVQQYVYHFLKSATKILESKCESNTFKLITTGNHPNMIVRPPLGSLAMDTWKDPYSKYRIDCTDFFYPASHYLFSYAWAFQLDSNLHLNLSFSTFFVKDFFTHCGRGKMILQDISPTTVESFALCGKRPNFTHYSSSSFIYLEIKYEIALPVEIYFLFAVFAKNIVSSVHRLSIIPLTYQLIKSDDIFAYLMHVLNGILSTFRIHTSKTHKICLWTNLHNNNTYIFIDGPIVTASKSYILKLNYNRTCSSTFQLILQIFSTKSEDYFAFNFAPSFYLSYDTFKGDFKTIQVDETIGKWKFTFPGLLFANTSNIHILQFKTIREIQINLTLLFVKYEGMETSDCRYGGISIFDQNIHILDICSNYGIHKPPRNIYSTYSHLSIVLYNYFPHSSISSTILVSTTKCKAVRIYLCEHARLPSEDTFDDNKCWQERIAPKSNINVEISHYKSNDILATIQAGKCGILQASTDFIDTFCPQDAKHYRTICDFFLHIKMKMESDVFVSGYSEEIKVKSKKISNGYNYVSFTAISKSLFCFDFTNSRYAQSRNKIYSTSKTCLIRGNDAHTGIFAIYTLASIIKLRTTTLRSGKRNIDFVMKSEISNSKVVKIQQLKLNGSFDTFHEYSENTLSIRLVDERECEQFKNKHIVVYLKFIHSMVVDLFLWIWEFQAHISCLEPVFYAFISHEVSHSFYSILTKSSSDILLEASWINSVPSRLKHNKCISSRWKSFANTSVKSYNCTKNMVVMEVFPKGMSNISWKSVSELCVNVGGHLPVFRSMFDLEEFMIVPRHFRGQQLNALFIGLYSVPGKSVSKMIFFPQNSLSRTVLEIFTNFDRWLGIKFDYKPEVSFV